MESIKVKLLDSKTEVQYGLNWGQRENRDPNQAYLSLDPEIYKGDYFPPKGKYFIVKTDDNKTLIFNRAQKTYGNALQTPENNAILGHYLRQRMGVASQAEITKEDILNYGKLDIDFSKIDDMNYTLSFPYNWKSKNLLYIYQQYLLVSRICNTWEEIDGHIAYLNLASEKISELLEKEIRIINYDDVDSFKRNLTETILDAEDISVGNKNLNEILTEYQIFLESSYFNLHYKMAVASETVSEGYRRYVAAVKSKPFLLLAGISGTGKSRIVRELARACWDAGSAEHQAQKPCNFEMVQVKPNWHDSSELMGYVSRIGTDKDGKARPEFVAGDFLKFIARAWENEEVPYFLCLDEMNLAPVEQYFAEYLSVIESRKADGEGNVTTDPILKKSNEQWYFDLTARLTEDEAVRTRFNAEGITIPQNLIVVGTVNMDETTFSFSRKVLDRAMTIEMNEVDLRGGLTSRHEPIGKLGKESLTGTAVEGADVYGAHRAVCDTVLGYLEAVNERLEGTPFKVAYRTRNEFLLYAVNNLPHRKDDESEGFVVARALDEITSMKVLSRIEGDDTKVPEGLLKGLRATIEEKLNAIAADTVFTAEKITAENKTDENGNKRVQSVSMAKIDEMIKRLSSGYTSFWS